MYGYAIKLPEYLRYNESLSAANDDAADSAIANIGKIFEIISAKCFMVFILYRANLINFFNNPVYRYNKNMYFCTSAC